MDEVNNVIVKPGVSGRTVYSNFDNPDLSVIASELSLLSIGDFEPLHFKIDCNQFMQEIAEFTNDWVDYLPRTDRPNNRKSLTLTNLPGKTHRDNPSLAQASVAAGRRLSENEFSEKTIVYDKCHSLHSLLNEFSPLGRTFLVRADMGGYFVPHRDHPQMPRDCFRIAVFLNNCSPTDYDWISETDKKLSIEMGRAYYINTRKTHRTISWVNDSIHLIINVPFTTQNVQKILSSLRHGH
jgi:hypothetical protein